MPIKLVCFDMDETLIDFHLHNLLADVKIAPRQLTEQKLEDIFGKKGRAIRNPSEIRQTMRDLLGAGIKIAITSHSSYQSSFPFILKKIGLTPEEIAQVQIVPFSAKDIKASRGPVGRWLLSEKKPRTWKTKEKLIEMARKEVSCDKNEVAFVEDDKDYVRAANDAGYKAICVDWHGTGYLDELREMAGLEPLSSQKTVSTVPPAEPEGTKWRKEVGGVPPLHGTLPPLGP
ncbi:MAG: HAD family hydrolase [Alphaproteobacteria bacterium]|nr:HAD family hydrolase [Alphaproteobacteria bacterium]